MKIELGEEHFNMALGCPNCGQMFNLPDPNELKEQNQKLSKEIEELKSQTKHTNTNTVSMKRKMGTLKVGKNDLEEEEESSDLLRETCDKLKKENEVLSGKLKGLQSANLTLNAELDAIKAKSEDVGKGIQKAKELQKEISAKDKVIKTLEEQKKKLSDKLAKFDELTNKIQSLAKEKTMAGTNDSANVLSMDETLDAVPVVNAPLAETIGALEELDDVDLNETLELSITAIQNVAPDETVKVIPTNKLCIKCQEAIDEKANFCTFCGSSQ